MPLVLQIEPGVPSQRFGVTLSETQYVIDLHWNQRDTAWYMDLMEEDETPIRMGIKLALGSPLGSRSTSPKFPPGSFALADLSGQHVEATLDDLGKRVLLMFLTPEELSA